MSTGTDRQIVALISCDEIGNITRSLGDIGRAIHASSNPKHKASAKVLQSLRVQLLEAVGMEEVGGGHVVAKSETEPKAKLHLAPRRAESESESAPQPSPEPEVVSSLLENRPKMLSEATGNDLLALFERIGIKLSDEVRQGLENSGDNIAPPHLGIVEKFGDHAIEVEAAQVAA